MDIVVSSELSVDSLQEWGQFWDGCSHAYARQHPIYASIEREQGRSVVFVSGAIEGRLKCTGIFSTRPLINGDSCSLEAYCLRGPAFDDCSVLKPYLEGVLRTFRSLKTGRVRISPYWKYPDAEEVEDVLKRTGFFPCSSPGAGKLDTGVVDVTRTESEMLSSFSVKTRQHIRSVEKLSVNIRPVESFAEALDGFNCLNEMRIQRGLTPMSLGEFRGTFDAVFSTRKYGVLFHAYGDSLFLGVLGVLRSSETVVPPIYAVDNRNCTKYSKNLSIGPALWWRAMLWAKETGCQWLDVEGYSPDTPRTSHLYHIHEFKRKLRPQPVQLLDQYVSVTSMPVHTLGRSIEFGKRAMKLSKSLPYQIRKLRLRSKSDER